MSQLSILRPILRFLPEVQAPSSPPTFTQRATWTVIALLLFFAMYNIVAVGVDPRLIAQSDFMQVVTASRMGSLITTGIGPIVLASIFLQLFVGAKILDVNLKNPEDKKDFYGTQKLLAFVLCLFEAYAFVILGHLPVINLFGGEQGTMLTSIFVMLQIAFGSVVLLFLDEVVSKHGIGSGISLFIAAGVSLAIIGGVVQLFVGESGVFAVLSSGGAEVIANALWVMTPLFATIAVFLVIVYVEGIKIEVPLAFERARGVGVGFPIKFTYVSNIPVILAFALLANLQLMAAVMANPGFQQMLCIGGQWNTQADIATACTGGINLGNYLGLATPGSAGSPPRFVDGLFYLITPIYRSVGHDYSYLMTSTPVLGIPEWAHVVIYIIFLMIICVIFGQFWVETTNMGPKEVADQLDSSGLQIPGYRRDPRIVASMLEKYIPPIVVMGSAFVGLLAGLADLTGALGTGTGILLTVGIVYKLYQDIERQNVFSSSSLASKFLGR